MPPFPASALFKLQMRFSSKNYRKNNLDRNLLGFSHDHFPALGRPDTKNLDD